MNPGRASKKGEDNDARDGASRRIHRPNERYRKSMLQAPSAHRTPLQGALGFAGGLHYAPQGRAVMNER